MLCALCGQPQSWVSRVVGKQAKWSESAVKMSQGREQKEKAREGKQCNRQNTGRRVQWWIGPLAQLEGSSGVPTAIAPPSGCPHNFFLTEESITVELGATPFHGQLD